MFNESIIIVFMLHVVLAQCFFLFFLVPRTSYYVNGDLADLTPVLRYILKREYFRLRDILKLWKLV